MTNLPPNVKVFARTVEDEAFQQIHALADCPAYADSKIRIMPDCHAGKGCTIGTTMTITDKITPNLVGVDVGCGMYVVPLKKTPDPDFARFDAHLRNAVPSGNAVRDFPLIDDSSIIWREVQQLRCASAIDHDYAMRSLGTLGGGNHFIEVDVDDDGEQYLVIHSGSRNLGVRVARYYQSIAERQCAQPEGLNEVIARLKAEGRQREIQQTIASMRRPSVSKELAYVSGQYFQDYLHDMSICQLYARWNRELIAEMLLGRDFHARALRDMPFHTIHNYIDTDHMILRKGAVSARVGEDLIIPMNMRDGSLLCVGRGNPDWNYSAPHGAGRLMSRTRAKETLSMSDFEQSMQGIYTTSVSTATIDEAPMAYKPMAEIMDCIGDTVGITKVLHPVYNFKAADA